MPPNTSRVTGESSCCWNTEAAMPERAVTVAKAIPIRRTSCGPLRRLRSIRGHKLLARSGADPNR